MDVTTPAVIDAVAVAVGVADPVDIPALIVTVGGATYPLPPFVIVISVTDFNMLLSLWLVVILGAEIDPLLVELTVKAEPVVCVTDPMLPELSP